MTRRDPRRFDSFCQHLVRYLSLLNTRSAVAQLVERVAVNHQVTGSSPVRGARLSTATFGGWPFFSQSGGPLIPPAAGPSATSQVEAKRRCRPRRYSSPVRGASLVTATFSRWPFFSQSGGPLIPRSAGPSATSQVEAKRRCRPRRYSSPVRGARLSTATFSGWPFPFFGGILHVSGLHPAIGKHRTLLLRSDRQLGPALTSTQQSRTPRHENDKTLCGSLAPGLDKRTGDARRRHDTGEVY